MNNGVLYKIENSNIKNKKKRPYNSNNNRPHSLYILLLCLFIYLSFLRIRTPVSLEKAPSSQKKRPLASTCCLWTKVSVTAPIVQISALYVKKRTKKLLQQTERNNAREVKKSIALVLLHLRKYKKK